MVAPTTDEFRAELSEILRAASRSGQSYIDVNAGSLHRRIGGYPTPFKRMPMCCAVMREMLRLGDEVLAQPPSGKGASLTIRYRLPH